MTALTYSQLEGVWLQAAQGTKYDTQTWAALMAAIAEAESGGNPGATNPNDNGGTQTSWGLWQISLGNHAAPSPSWSDPVTNAQLAIGKLNGQGLSAWGTYDSGAYRQYLNGSTTPSGNFPSGPGATTAAATSGGGSATLATYNANACLIGIPNLNPIPSWVPIAGTSSGFCILSKSEARALLGGALMVAGGIGAMIGFIVLAAGAFQRTGGLGKAADIAAVIPGAQPVAAGLAVAQRRTARTGAQAASRRSARRGGGQNGSDDAQRPETPAQSA